MSTKFSQKTKNKSEELKKKSGPQKMFRESKMSRQIWKKFKKISYNKHPK